MIDHPRIATREDLERWADLGNQVAAIALETNPDATLFGVEDNRQPQSTVYVGFASEDRARVWLDEF